MELHVPCKILVRAYSHSALISKLQTKVISTHLCITEEEIISVLSRGRHNLEPVLVIVHDPSTKTARSRAMRALLQNALNYHMYVVVFSPTHVFPRNLRTQFKYILRGN